MFFGTQGVGGLNTVPDQKYTFGVVKTAQARGDFEVC
jgi:hypothetical protein